MLYLIITLAIFLALFLFVFIKMTSQLRVELQQNLFQATQTLEQKMLGVDTRLESSLKEGFRHFEKVQEHLKQTENQLSNLNLVGKSIQDLNNLLKLPHLRGGFGEASLERILSDILPAGSYEMEYQISQSSGERVDAAIKYPNQILPIDSKFPREQILALFETEDPHRLEEARNTLINVIRIQAKNIKEKYIKPEHGTTDMALIFVPSETLYFEIIRNQKVCEDLHKFKVFPVSPNTLAITLHAISIAKNYYDMAKGVEETVLDIKKARNHYENFDKKFQEVGKSLGKSLDSFNTASTHLSRYSSAVYRLTGEEETASALEGTPPKEINH
jgi:DNA recombination protein RmuC